MPLKVEQIHIFIARDIRGNEMVVMGQVGPMMVPLIAADDGRLLEIRPIAEKLARDSGLPLHLVRFDQRSDVETISGLPPGAN